eukprot:14983092-Ditylum_brightwellii.AAC.1
MHPKPLFINTLAQLGQASDAIYIGITCGASVFWIPKETPPTSLSVTSSFMSSESSPGLTYGPYFLEAFQRALSAFVETPEAVALACLMSEVPTTKGWFATPCNWNIFITLLVLKTAQAASTF